MSKDLAPLKDKSVDELREMSTAMRQYLTAENETALKTALNKIGQNPSLMARFFPTALQKEEQRIVLQKMRATAKAQEEMYRLYTDVQLEIARRQGDNLIAAVELALQAKLSSFAQLKFYEVQQAFKESRQRFAQQIKPELDSMENYKDIPDLYELAVQSIKDDLRVFFKIIDQLRDGFAAAIESKVKSFRR